MSDVEAQFCLRDGLHEKVALGFMREAVKYGRKCCRGSLGDDELVSLCYPALLHAAENYKARHGISFFGFSKQYIRGAISREWRRRDVVRNSSRHETEAPLEKPGESQKQTVPTVHPDFESLDLQERWAIVLPVIQKRLNAVERMVIVMRHKAGFSFQEIADCRGVSRQAIARTHGVALKKLRCALAHKRALL